MQTYDNYDFTLYNASNLPLVQFNEISGLINQICLKAKQACEHSVREELVVSFVIEKKTMFLGSVYICDNNVSFAVIKEDLIQTFCDAKELEDYCNSPSTKFLPNRIYNQLRLVLDRKIPADSLSFPEVKELWEEHLRCRQAKEQQAYEGEIKEI